MSNSADADVRDKPLIIPTTTLKEYYTKYFPIDAFWDWLHPKNEDNRWPREFSFTCLDRWYRFEFFEDKHQFRNALITRCPQRIDVGATYRLTHRPDTSKVIEKNFPIDHELILDIDASDFDDVRTCCEGPNICEKCWKLMAIACEILDESLRTDFNFEYILWTFSGRRGIHAWVCDENARSCTSKNRKFVAKIVDTRTCGSMKLGFPPRLQRAINIIKPHFEEILVEQMILDTPEGTNNLLKPLPPNVRDDINRIFVSCTNSPEKLAALQSFIDQIKIKEQCYFLEEIMIGCCYPRIDVQVTAQISHLLKAPFSVHPGTGRISIPFRPDNVWEFKIPDVPVVSAVVGESCESIENKEIMMKNFNEARLHFENFVKGIMSMEKSMERVGTGWKLRTKPDRMRLSHWLAKLPGPNGLQKTFTSRSIESFEKSEDINDFRTLESHDDNNLNAQKCNVQVMPVDNRQVFMNLEEWQGNMVPSSESGAEDRARKNGQSNSKSGWTHHVMDKVSREQEIPEVYDVIDICESSPETSRVSEDRESQDIRESAMGWEERTDAGELALDKCNADGQSSEDQRSILEDDRTSPMAAGTAGSSEVALAAGDEVIRSEDTADNSSEQSFTSGTSVEEIDDVPSEQQTQQPFEVMNVFTSSDDSLVEQITFSASLEVDSPPVKNEFESFTAGPGRINRCPSKRSVSPLTCTRYSPKRRLLDSPESHEVAGSDRSCRSTLEETSNFQWGVNPLL
ncbi:uncharacterized protein LOC135165801 [Diachasmimorpha longicaudata]|uniref:uncharacterized protein LOC135165801 n=1 Tax=Diachasmimorpha longicaudata TaxID=58733 RepID=UPI0030B87A74